VAAAEEPAATTVPAPSLPTGSDSPTLAAAARIAPGLSGAVTTGRSAVPPAVAWVTSAPAKSSPRSEGLMGAASTRTTTWCGAGVGTATSSSDNVTVSDAVTSERSCSAVPSDTCASFVPRSPRSRALLAYRQKRCIVRSSATSWSNSFVRAIRVPSVPPPS